MSSKRVREPDDGQRREQRRRRRAEQHRGLEEVAERTSQSSRARSSPRTPSGPSTSVSASLLERRGRSRPSARRRAARSRAGRAPAARSGRGRRRGRSCRRRRRRRPRGRSRRSRPTIPAPLSIRTGGRISSTLRPQWVTKPASSAASATSSIAASASSSSGVAAPVQGGDRLLVLQAHAQPAQLLAEGVVGEGLHAARPRLQLAVQLGRDRPRPQHLRAVRAEVGDRAERRRSGARPTPAGRTRRPRCRSAWPPRSAAGASSRACGRRRAGRRSARARRPRRAGRRSAPDASRSGWSSSSIVAASEGTLLSMPTLAGRLCSRSRISVSRRTSSAGASGSGVASSALRRAASAFSGLTTRKKITAAMIRNEITRVEEVRRSGTRAVDRERQARRSRACRRSPRSAA